MFGMSRRLLQPRGGASRCQILAQLRTRDLLSELSWRRQQACGVSRRPSRRNRREIYPQSGAVFEGAENGQLRVVPFRYAWTETATLFLQAWRKIGRLPDAGNRRNQPRPRCSRQSGGVAGTEQVFPLQPGNVLLKLPQCARTGKRPDAAGAAVPSMSPSQSVQTGWEYRSTP